MMEQEAALTEVAEGKLRILLAKKKSWGGCEDWRYGALLQGRETEARTVMETTGKDIKRR